MNNLKNIALILTVLFLATSCILEDVEPEYDVVGAVGTIATLTASTTNPEPGQTVTFTLNIYSEHENATELRMNRVSGGTATNLETKTFSNWNTDDSYVETFQYTVPSDAAGSTITMQFVLVTESNFTAERTINLTVSGGS
ncbi:hypothetical protein [Arthrospiribacter ruber]|uniref:DUF4625 domain-containing protein n=1 Tax=Arthrospiribacter ruber TaxID=2487934 RepID=A0A951IQE9_9BACT|nr:hypothetical protein [Arthrospiribacter ruber]MBW3466460.1 hypothetical protein [Arthrospiribacter ruber]